MQVRTRWVAALCALAAVAHPERAAAQSEVRFSGYTNGCFNAAGDPACTPTNLNGAQAVNFAGPGGGAIRYDNADFDETTVSSFLALGGNPQGGVMNTNNLGAFSFFLPAAGSTGFGDVGFTLAITFTAPTPLIADPGSPVPIGGNTLSFTALLRGTITSTATGGVNVNFGNNTLNFFSVDTDPIGSDDFVFSFQLADVNINPNVNPASVTANIQALGGIRPTAAPEPSTYALLATGLAGVAVAARRRRRD